jgi:hypothetical protein
MEPKIRPIPETVQHANCDGAPDGGHSKECIDADEITCDCGEPVEEEGDFCSESCARLVKE